MTVIPDQFDASLSIPTAIAPQILTAVPPRTPTHAA